MENNEQELAGAISRAVAGAVSSVLAQRPIASATSTNANTTLVTEAEHSVLISGVSNADQVCVARLKIYNYQTRCVITTITIY